MSRFAAGASVWLAAATAVAGIAVGSGAVDVIGLLRSPQPAPAVAAAAPTPAAGASFVKIVKGVPVVAEPAEADVEVEAEAEIEAAPGCGGGRHQREIEQSLASLGAGIDCAGIRDFQQRYGIRPARGQADATTADVARRLATSSAQLDKCGAAPQGVTACVDLTNQTAWVVRDGAVVFGPTVVRTGYRGHATPAGTYTINKRAKREWSNPYEVWLPYWQRFVGGIGFHETTTYLHDKARGSHGCVNLLHRDAVTMWEHLEMDSRVHTFGRRPGT